MSKKVDCFFYKPIELNIIMKNDNLMILRIRHNLERVLKVSMSPFSGENQFNFHEVKISALKNAFTLAKRPILSYTFGVQQL